MWDLIRADQLSQELILRDTSKKAKRENLRLYQDVFKLHKITKEEFDVSYNFYNKRPDIFRVMIDSLQAKKSREIESQNMKLKDL